MTHPNQVITSLHISEEDWPAYLEHAKAIQEMLKKHIDPVFTFVHRDVRDHPPIMWNGCQFIKKEKP